MSIEFAVLAPAMIMFTLLIVGGARMSLSAQKVDAAAAAAARAASLERGGSQKAAAEQAARDTLQGKSLACRSMRVSVDLSDAEPGGQVRTRVWCTASLSDVAISHLPGSFTYRSSGISPIGQYRSED